MATTVASRFAVLSLDEDDPYSRSRKKNASKKPPEAKPGNTSSKTDNNSKKKKKTDSGQVQNKPKQKSNANKKKKEPTPQQWEEWKEKDIKFVEGNYEDEMSQAILLSKLDYEEKKEFYEAMKKSQEEEKKPNKKNKKKVMTLEEFNNLGEINSRDESPSVVSVDNEIFKEDPEFFNRLKDEVKKELSKESLLEQKRNREVYNHEAVTIAQYQELLNKKELENSVMKEELAKVKEELLNVKTRNKKLYHILANGEMKEKAEVLMEVDRLEGVKDELSKEIQSLYAQLEQERSKVRALTSDTNKSKDKNKKRTVSSSDNPTSSNN